VAVQTKNAFLDPADFASLSVYDLLVAAARGHVGIDRHWVRAIVERGEEAVEPLLRFGLEDRSSDPVNLEEDLIAMFRYLRSSKALPFYIKCIREAPDDVTDELIDAIVPFGAEAVEPLLALHEELGEEEGSDVAFLLAALGVQDERIRKLLVDRLEFDAGDAALALGVYRDPGAKPALESMFASIPEAEEQLRREFALAIEACDEPRPEPAEVEVEPKAFDIWELFPEDAVPPVEILSEVELRDMLASPSAEYRREAALAFRNRTDYTPESRDRLLLITREDSSGAVRGAAWEALGEKLDESGIRGALKKAAGDESRDMKERTGALVGLAQASDDRTIAALIWKFYEKPEARAKALEAMWRSFDKQFAEVLPKHLDDPDSDSRRAAIWGVGYLGLGSYAGKIESMFNIEDLRADALFSYSLLAPSEVTHARVPALFRKINEVAGGLTYGEAELVQTALDQRLVMHGLDPYFANADEDAEEWDENAEPEKPAGRQAAAAPQVADTSKAGRNDPCPCGSGKKYKKCHGA